MTEVVPGPVAGIGLRTATGAIVRALPGLRLLTMDALYAERDLCQAIVGHGRDYLVHSRRCCGIDRRVCRGGTPQAETLEKKRAFLDPLATLSWDFPGRQGAMVEKESVDIATGEVTGSVGITVGTKAAQVVPQPLER